MEVEEHLIAKLTTE